MARRKKSVATYPPHWTVSTECLINGRHVVRGTELSIQGERGRYRFIKHVALDSGVEWVDVIGGPKGYEVWRSFYVGRVKRVHWKNKTRENS